MVYAQRAWCAHSYVAFGVLIMPIEEVIHQCRQLMYAHSKRILDYQLIVLLRLAYTQG